jgi:signal transduction histidine kinase
MLGQVLQNRLKEEPENREMLSSLVKEIDRLDRIIREMIERSKPGDLKKQWGNINQQMAEVIRVAEESLTSQNISIKQNLSDHLPKIYLDQEKLKQVLWNLILNAKDAMPGGGQLTLSTGVAKDGSIEISVEDTGRGVSSGDLERLFDPFFTTKPEGMGLGLTVSRNIVEKHGGKLTLEKRSEGGTIARVVFPAHSE